MDFSAIPGLASPWVAAAIALGAWIGIRGVALATGLVLAGRCVIYGLLVKSHTPTEAPISRSATGHRTGGGRDVSAASGPT